MSRVRIVGLALLWFAGCSGNPIVPLARPTTPYDRLERMGCKVTRGTSETGEPSVAVTLRGGQTDEVWAELRQVEGLCSLSLLGSWVTDSSLHGVGLLKGLRWLTIESATELTEDGWRGIADLPELFSLSLFHTPISEPSAHQISRLPKLSSALFRGCQLTDETLGALSSARTMEELLLPENEAVTDTGVKKLLALSGLKQLNLADTQVTDAGLKLMTGFQKLERLVLSSTTVTDEGLKELRGLESLRTLDVSWTGVTDLGLDEVREWKRLTALFVIDAKTTAEGIRKFRSDNPDCSVYGSQ